MVDFRNKKLIEKLRKFTYGFTVYGVKVGIETNRKYLLDDIKAQLPEIFPVEFSEIKYVEAERFFAIKHIGNEAYKLYFDNEEPEEGTLRLRCVNYFLSHLRIKTVEYAESKVFLHAGVVGWNGEAIIIPGNSHDGKTTLVKELVKIGAEYYSDEYAVLDENGFVHPFPKTLSVRGIIDDYSQKEIKAEEFGQTGIEPIPVGLVLITKYEKSAKFKPEKLSKGKAILEILPHTLPIRFNAEFSLFVLNKILSRAIILKSKRGEAPHIAKIVTNYLT